MNKWLYFLLAILTTSSLADDFDDAFSDNVFSDDVFSDDAFSDISSESPSPFSIAHELSVSTITNVNSDKSDATETLYSGITSTRFQYRPTLSYQLNESWKLSADAAIAADTIFWLREDDTWSDEDIDARQFEMNVYELLAQGRINQWQLSTGIQNVTLGLADVLSVSNILYAQDLSVPGTTDLDDTIKPAWTTMASGSIGSIRARVGAVHTHEVNDTPVLGSDFDVADPDSGLTMNQMLAINDLTVEPKELSLENMAFFASLAGVLGPLDWQLNGVSQLEHSPTIELGLVGMTPAPVALHYPRTQTFSLAASYVTGPVLWKLEGAFIDGLEGQVANGMMPGELMAYQRVASTAGFDFDHSTLGRVVFEVQVGTVLDYDSYDFLSVDETSAQWALMVSKNFLRETLTVIGQVISFDLDSSGGRIQGFGLEYDFSDSVSADLRYVDYVEGDFQFLQGADDRDRILGGIAFSF